MNQNPKFKYCKYSFTWACSHRPVPCSLSPWKQKGKPYIGSEVQDVVGAAATKLWGWNIFLLDLQRHVYNYLITVYNLFPEIQSQMDTYSLHGTVCEEYTACTGRSLTAISLCNIFIETVILLPSRNRTLKDRSSLRKVLLHPTATLHDLYSKGHSPSCKNVPSRLCTEKCKWKIQMSHLK